LHQLISSGQGSLAIVLFSGFIFAFGLVSKLPLSVASQSGFCQGEMYMDVHFSFDKQGRASKRP